MQKIITIHLYSAVPGTKSDQKRFNKNNKNVTVETVESIQQIEI